jgi:hypothetical protein
LFHENHREIDSANKPFLPGSLCQEDLIP